MSYTLSMGFRIIWIVGLFFALSAHAAEREWRSVYIDGVKVGHGYFERKFDGDNITIEESLTVKIRQPGSPFLKVTIEIVTKEAIDGNPVYFRREVDTAKINAITEGRFINNRVFLQTKLNGELETSEVLLDTPVLFPEAQRRKLTSEEPLPDTVINYYAFDYSSFEPVSVETTILGTEILNIMNSETRLTKVAQKTQFPGGRTNKITAYLNEDRVPQRIITELLGVETILERTSKSQALSRSRSFDHMERSLIRSPYVLTDKALKSAIRFELQSKDGSVIQLPETFEQHVRKSGAVVEVDICKRCGRETAPTRSELETYLQPNIWLQSDHPDIQKLAKKSTRNTTSSREKMEKLTRTVNRKMRGEIFFIGYASALEALQSGRGDCTEYALLLAALGRAAGIPTRVASGIVYSQERFHGRRWVFVPHAWVQAWIDNRWESFDGALDDFDSSHIVFGVGHGDQPSFVASMHNVDNIKITTAGMLVKPATNSKSD